MTNYHVPIFKKEIIDFLRPENTGAESYYVDATLGDGGHTKALAEKLEGRAKIISIDRDADAINRAKQRLQEFENIIYVNDSYENLKDILSTLGIDRISGIIFDLGISSFQIDNSGRGFSFMRNEKLDMRMNQSSGESAKDLLNNLPEKDLADIIWRFGEERWSFKIAGGIGRERNIQPFEYTSQLVDVVKSSIPKKFHPKHHHVATKTFQAIRIAVNKELVGLRDIFIASADFLVKGGRICVISFHSLEDRIAKDTFKHLAGRCTCPPKLPQCGCDPLRMLKILTTKSLIPAEEEVKINPRARSAKLRVAERI